ncbi:DUF192 domain-containing protein [Sphingomonas antarctica]|uniref:DUF192 domain-containing protein n=1 Tax=Sphingomonas antarctica TaxID=2040274 RepID=UPI0039E920CC
MPRFMTLLALLLLTPAVPALAKDRSQHLAAVPLTITSGGRVARFRTEVAKTSLQQEKGLMFRTKLGPAESMIFPMKPPRFASFWMKNTLIPLDIVFIRPDGTIHRIANARALDLTPVESYEPVAAVLEIAGGRAAQLGLHEGDRVASPALAK